MIRYRRLPYFEVRGERVSRAVPLEEARRRCLERLERADRARFEADCGRLLVEMVDALQAGTAPTVRGSILGSDGLLEVEVRRARPTP